MKHTHRNPPRERGACLRMGVGVLLLVSSLGYPAWAQQARPPDDEDRERPRPRVPDDPMSRPTEAGFRFTPELARGMATLFAKEALHGHYEMDEAKLEEATDLISRRLMETAHELDGPAQKLVERFVEEQLGQQKEGVHEFMPRGFGKEFAGQLVPMLPTVRTLCRDVVRDVRPMLPFKQQLKLAGELVAFNTAFDGFESTMQKWASGEVAEFGNPFDRSGQSEISRDAEGNSITLLGARQTAQAELENQQKSEWEQYVKDATAYYGFDGAQVAAAESVLREYLGRFAALTGDESWRSRFWCNRVWNNMIWQIPNGWGHPLRAMIEDEHEELFQPVTAMRNEFKHRVNQLATGAQRQAGEERVQALLIEKGIVFAEQEASDDESEQ